MKVVVDTNVLVSGIFWGGKPGQVLDHWSSGKFNILATIDILEEYLRVLGGMGKKDPELVEHWTNFLLQRLILIEKTTVLRASRDPFDNKFLECAVSADATCIVSGDDDLLVLKRIQEIPIFRVSQFLSKYF